MGVSHYPEKDLRKHPRVDLHIKAEYRFYTPGNEKARFSFETHDISAGGLMFYSDRFIKVGTEIELKLFLDKEFIDCAAKVVWSERRPNSAIPNSPYATGLQYSKISPENREKLSKQALRLIQVK